MTAIDHASVVQKFFDAFAASEIDIEVLIGLMHPDIVWELPGRSPVAGRHVGLDAVGAMMMNISVMAGGTEKLRMTEMFLNGDGAVALVEVDMSPSGDAPLQGQDAWLLRTDGQQVTYIREHWSNTRDFDELSAWSNT